MFKRPSSDIQFISVTLVLVVLLGARTFFSLTEEEGRTEEPSAVATAESHSSEERRPASLSVAVAKPGSALDQFTKLDLNCSRKPAGNMSVQGSFVQFQGKSCLKSLDVEIVNKSNGYTASVFQRGEGGYQTDLIQLESGENEIAIRYRERSGKSVEEIVRVLSKKI